MRATSRSTSYHPRVDDLDRFLIAQDEGYAGALAELRAGRKEEHWIWWVFPQLRGLGTSAESIRYGIASRREAQAYAAHPVLGARLRECAAVLLALDAGSIQDILPSEIDVRKLRSSMTLFGAVTGEPLFGQVIDRWLEGERDDRTRQMLAGG